MIRIAPFSLRKLAVPAVAAALLSFTTGLAPADTSGAAGKAIERITAETTVVSSVDYQVTLPLSCAAAQGLCGGDFPTVANRRRLILTRMSCYMRSSSYASFAAGRIVQAPEGSVTEFLPVDHSTDYGYHVLNRAIDVRVPARQHASVYLQLASGGQAMEGQCTAHGTLETLQ